jgi:hypothetical protein
MRRWKCVSRWSRPPSNRCRHHGLGPLEALLAPLFATLDALFGAMSGNIGRLLIVTTWCHLPASLSRVKHACLVAGGLLGGDATWLLERVPEEITMSALVWAPCTMLGQSTHATLLSLVASLGLDVLALPL